MKKQFLFTLLVCATFYMQSQIDSIIYGLARTSSPNAVFLAKINPSTGSVTNISTFSVAAGEQTPNATIDRVNKIYYFVNTNSNIVGLSLLTGLVVSSNLITNFNATYFEQLLYNSADSVIYGLAITTSPNAVFLAKINPSTGSVTNISTFSVAAGEQSPNATIDPVNKIYYFVSSGGNIIGLSLLTGAIVSNQPVTNANATSFEQLLYNCSDTTIYGLARTSSPNAVFLAKINPSTGSVTNISTFSVAAGEQTPNATIDPFHKIYYFVNTTNEIVGLSLLTGSIVSSQPITNASATYFQQLLYNSNYCVNSVITGVENKFLTNKIDAVYPNPNSGQFELKIDAVTNETIKIKIYNVIGKLVYETEALNNETDKKINMDDVSNGIYFIKVSSGNKEYTKKIIVSK